MNLVELIAHAMNGVEPATAIAFDEDMKAGDLIKEAAAARFDYLPTQEDIPMTYPVEQSQSFGPADVGRSNEPQSNTPPAERFAQSVDYLAQTLDMLTTTVDELLGDLPPAGQAEEAMGRSTPSIVALVHQYPDIITRTAEQLAKQNERLRDAFLRG